MARISDEKHQLSETLDIMSSELANLQNSIASQDNQENPQCVLDNGAALEKMLGAIELGHNRAEQLERNIGILQVRELHFLALSFPFDLCSIIVMQILHRDVHRLFYSAKTNPLDSIQNLRSSHRNDDLICFWLM